MQELETRRRAFSHQLLPQDWDSDLLRFLLLGRKVTTNLDSVLKSRDITLLTKEINTEYSLERLMLRLIPWPPDAKNRLIGKHPDAGKNWRQEKGTTEDKMVGQHHRLNGHKLEKAQEDGEGQGSLSFFSPRGCKEWDTTERPNHNYHIHSQSGYQGWRKSVEGSVEVVHQCWRVWAAWVNL